ncbi:uncharacterized protein LOC113363965 [Ctenocephalides felis]|uniref:uncharacterized protein LOC113363965 n=1 Tax=Ctenocephalides felis TaxID=7515 RepID=UPI000E6E4D2F|nr:uncharacterized protein LOC113363965 [Ctenocephalides felis]
MKFLSVFFLVFLVLSLSYARMTNLEHHRGSRHHSKDHLVNDIDNDFNTIDDLDSHIFAPKINPISPLARDSKTNHRLVEKTVSGIFAPDSSASRRRIEKSLHYKRKWLPKENLDIERENEIEDQKYNVKINFDEFY